jgi:hypothetical protein
MLIGRLTRKKTIGSFIINGQRSCIRIVTSTTTSEPEKNLFNYLLGQAVGFTFQVRFITSLEHTFFQNVGYSFVNACEIYFFTLESHFSKRQSYITARIWTFFRKVRRHFFPEKGEGGGVFRQYHQVAPTEFKC